VVAFEIAHGNRQQPAQQADCQRSLDGDHHRRFGSIADFKISAGRVLAKPGHDTFAVRGVADHQPVVLEARDDHVVEYSAIFPADVAVPGLSDDRITQTARTDIFEKPFGVRAGQFDSAHVRDVEYGRGGTSVSMLLDDAGEQEGHFPSCEIDHLGAESGVEIVERCP